MANRRVSFIVDGFNLYHSIRAAERSSPGTSLRWLDIRALCDSYLSVIGGGAAMASIYYFSAYADHLESAKPGIVARHRAYIEALKNTGIEAETSRFKRKEVRCSSCATIIRRYEEKETDVAIGVKLLELAFTCSCEVLVLVSGDTDLLPAVRTARRVQPSIEVWSAFPYMRANKDLAKATTNSFKLGLSQYAAHQLPASITLSSGRTITKPPSW